MVAGSAAAGSKLDRKEREQLIRKLEKKSEKYKKQLKQAGKLDKPAQRAALQQLLLEKLCKVADKLEAVAPSPPAPPVREQQQQAAAKHVNRFSKQVRLPQQQLPLTEEFARRSLRQQRFVRNGDASSGRSEAVLLDETGGTGTCEVLEKEYLRLTSLPLASNVRPPHVLAKALALVKARWRDSAAYSYTREQLKAIRQDLTVQHIRDALAVQVYETHARIAIEVGDWAELKQCLAMLKQLYGEGQHGSQAEFATYGLLLAVQSGADIYSHELASLPEQLLAHEQVQHAMAVCWAYRSSQPRKFVNLYPDAIRMAAYLMDEMLPKVREVGLKALLLAFNPTAVPLSYVAEELGFEDADEAADYLRGYGVVLDSRARIVDTRASRAAGRVGLPAC